MSMPSSDYNKYLSAIKTANDMEYHRSVETLRSIYNEMVAKYGANDSDVDYLYRNYFRHNI